MLRDYEISDNKCVVCGNDSKGRPLCPLCYKYYLVYYNNKEELAYCNKNVKFAILKLFAYFDNLENKGLEEDKTEFLIDFAVMLRPFVQNENEFTNEKYKKIINELHTENKKLKNELETVNKSMPSKEEISDPRKKWAAKFRCKDGHYVRSRAELLIDNWLYSEGIKHSYEKLVSFPNGEKKLCDFYLPDYKIYIEYWGLTEDYYIERKNDKIKLYDSLQDVTLVQLDDKSLETLDDIMEEKIKLQSVLK